MPLSDFTQTPDVVSSVRSAQEAVAARPVSDLVDDAGKQYVDLVLEGGGVLGVALVGYTYVLEQAGLRFLGLAGTSAGAINALLLAALAKPDEPKSEALVELLANMPIASFLDGDSDARDFSKALAARAGTLKLLWKGVQVIDNMTNDIGLHPGKKFEQWLEQALASVNIRCLADLEARLATLPALKPRLRSPLAVIAAEGTPQTKATFPAMAELYWSDPRKVNPARFVRASMSIPFFFAPMKVQGCPQGPEASERWKKHTTYEGPTPPEVLFVDGGIISNFPISQFHDQERVPMAPTFGVKLSAARNYRKIDGPIDLAGAIIDSSRSALDQSFLLDNPDYRHLVANIAIDESQHNWLDFNLPKASQVALFIDGARKAAEFLQGFDWEGYKNLRSLKAKLRTASRAM